MVGDCIMQVIHQKKHSKKADVLNGRSLSIINSQLVIFKVESSLHIQVEVCVVYVVYLRKFCSWPNRLSFF